MLKVTPYLDLDNNAKQLVDHLNDTTVSLTFSEAQVLALLLSNPDAIFTKDQLLEVGWPERVVASTSLTQCVSTLRKKLEPYAEVQLKTIARRGYQIHVSEKSHVKMLAISDSHSIRQALKQAPLFVKCAGIALLLMLVGLVWYWSDYHMLIKQAHNWQADEKIDLNLGGVEANLPVFTYKDNIDSSLTQWQKHFISDTNEVFGMHHFNGFAATDGFNYSVAVCPEVEGQNECLGQGMINIAAIDNKPAQLNMVEFMQLTKVMENRIRYNQVFFPIEENAHGEITEHHYQADIYYPVANELLVRADLSLSLIYEDGNSGKFQSATCVTDQDCLTTPLKYTIRGDFKQYHQKIDGYDVDVFQVTIKQKSLTKPNKVSDSAMRFYREIRKHDITDDIVYFYRVYSDKNTAVWILPFMGETIAWTRYSLVKL
ncbi:winged helix-turn-helix domain-containing protein [Shewanella marina]|uniref:winged helix-turn-helix domain-containing protein n=1 Tax=Shewanella marina TaxID=487319 RepID=UPI000471A52A|nr:helix-turn-helix domain-containing protein [Shewanella marina]